MGNGWIKLHRKLWDNPIVTKDPDHLAVWIYLLTNATHEKKRTLFGKDVIYIKPGQLITGRKKISKVVGVNEHKVDRCIKFFISEQQIEQQATPYGSLISILNWRKYQISEQQSEQRVSNNRATSEQQNEQQPSNDKQGNNLDTEDTKGKSEQPPKRGNAKKVSTKQEEQEIRNSSSRKKDTKKSAEWLSDKLTEKEWARLKRTFVDVPGLIDYVDNQIIDTEEIEKPYQYILAVAERKGWKRKKEV